MHDTAQFRFIAASGMFDQDWYLKRYPDVASSGMHPLAHYLEFGSMLGRDPNEAFSAEYYLQANPDVSAAGLNPFFHYIHNGIGEHRPCAGRFEPATGQFKKTDHSHHVLPGSVNQARLEFKYVKGNVAAKTHRANVMAVAHVAGRRIYGGERSFLDIIDGLVDNDFNVMAVIPRHDNARYIAELKKRCVFLASLHYDWWRKDAAPDEMMVAAFEQLYRRLAVDAVHVNTIMLREPLLAARKSCIPGIAHVREIIQHDEALTDLIGLPAEEIAERVTSTADFIIANSSATKSCFPTRGRTYVLGNCVDTDSLAPVAGRDHDAINVVMLSSNLPKKGIHDAVLLAKLLESRQPEIRVILVGPLNEHVSSLSSQFGDEPLPSNLIFTDYFIDPKPAYEIADIVINLSHFQESFGRTVLEAMSAGVPVVAYEWGAVPELIVNGVNGYLAPFKDVEAVAGHVISLAGDRPRREAMGQAGRERAVSRYSKTSYARQLGKIYQQIFERTQRQEKPLVLDKGPSAKHKVSVIIPNYNYERFLEERIRSITEQTVTPHEIIFLDDLSSDRSLPEARKLLDQSGLRYRLFRNHENLGTYAQWQKGIELATGDFIWIAEADDSSSPDFLEKMLANMQDRDVVMSYSQSLVVDDKGKVIRSRNLHHTDALSSDRWLSDYTASGVREVTDFLVYRNSIPNVSACLFRTQSLRACGNRFQELRYCGDWLLYSELLTRGSVAYHAQPLNVFRRHSGSVTRSQGKSLDYFREIIEVKKFQISAFPVHAHQFGTIRKFIDSDYRFDSIKQNSDWSQFKAFMNQAKQQVSGRKRICFVTTNNGSFNGGSEMLWIETAAAMREKGHDVMVVIRDWNPPPKFIGAFSRAGIKVTLKQDDAEHAAIRRFAADLTIISMGDQDEGLAYFDTLNDADLPYVIVNQLTKQVEYWPLKSEKIMARVDQGYQLARKVSFTCRNNHRVMEERLGRKIENAEIHFNPYHLDRNPGTTWPDMGRGPQLAIPSKLLHVHKGQKLIIDLMSKQKWRKRNLTINLFGEGPDEAEFKQLVMERKLRNIYFHGRVADLMTIWNANHAILMPSFMEGLPIVLVGAMLSGRLPILTDIGGHAEVVENNVSGFIAAKPTVEDIEEALERALERLYEWPEIGEKARQGILDYLPEDPVADFVSKIEQCFDDLSAEAAERPQTAKTSRSA